MKKRIFALLITLLITILIPFTPTGAGPDPEIPAMTGLQVHFLDVGQGDCAVVLCDGEAMVVVSLVYLCPKRNKIFHFWGKRLIPALFFCLLSLRGSFLGQG